MNLTKNFSLSEFASKDGAATPESVIPNLRELAENLQALRDHLAVPITINSGYRSEAHNKKVGGVKNSQHRFGMAADIKVKGMTPTQVYEAIVWLISKGSMKDGGIGRYNTFTHYDIANPRRWDYRK